VSFKHTIMILACLIAAGCGAEQRAVPEISRSLSSPNEAKGIRINLTEAALNTQDDFDRFETQVLSKVEAEEAISIYDAMADKERAGTARTDVLLLSRQVLFYFERVSPNGKNKEAGSLFQRGLALKERLSKKHSDHPHTLFTEGYIRYKLYQLYGQTYRFEALRSGGKDLGRESVVQLKRLWSMLLEKAPAYDGPRDFDADKIREVLKRLEMVLKTPENIVAPLEPAPTNSPNLTVARESLWSMEHKPRQTQSICKDYQKAITGQEGLARPASYVEAEMGLRCGIQLGNRELAILGLSELIARGTKFDICKKLQTIRCQTQSKDCTRFEDALAKIGEARDRMCATSTLLTSRILELKHFSRISNMARIQTIIKRIETLMGPEGAAEAAPGPSPSDPEVQVNTGVIDFSEGAVRFRGDMNPNNTYVAFALSSRSSELDTLRLPAKHLEKNFHEAMTNQNNHQALTDLVASLLGSEVIVSLAPTVSDGVEGLFLKVLHLAGNAAKEKMDSSFFYVERDGRLQGQAFSYVRHTGPHTNRHDWMKPVFAAVTQAAPTPGASQPTKATDPLKPGPKIPGDPNPPTP
jgi:hypothetical protein